LIHELDIFCRDGWITEVLHTVKSGKEATVYCCQADPRTGLDLIAAKVYRPLAHRSFRNDAIYQEGRVILDKRLRRAVAKKTKAGRGCQSALWVDSEFATLGTLSAAGADVPKPYAQSGDAILMEYIGDREMAAPPLRHVRLEYDEARELFECLMRNIELWLSCNCVHGDLSAFNILYWRGSAKVIDFPQAIDARMNRNAFELLLRDITNVCTHLQQYGIAEDSYRLARSLWSRFIRGEL